MRVLNLNVKIISSITPKQNQHVIVLHVTLLIREPEMVMQND